MARCVYANEQVQAPVGWHELPVIDTDYNGQIGWVDIPPDYARIDVEDTPLATLRESPPANCLLVLSASDLDELGGGGTWPSLSIADANVLGALMVGVMAMAWVIRRAMQMGGRSDD